MDIAFILSSSRRTFGGMESIADGFAAALAARGHRLYSLAGTLRPSTRDVPTVIDGVELTPLAASSTAARWIARGLRTSPLNVQSLSFFLRLLMSARARRMIARVEVAITFFEGEAVLFSSHLNRRGVGTVYYYPGAIDRRWALRDRSTRRVAISSTVAEHPDARSVCPSDGVVWPGVPAALLTQPCRADDTDQPPGRLVYTGRLERDQKRPDRLISLFGELASEFRSLELRFVGDGSARGELEDLSRRAGVGDRVVFTGALKPADVHVELQQADVFLFPSDYESFGLSPVEAMAAGVPVVASDIPGLREATGGHAWLLAPHDTSAWVAATRQLLRDGSMRRERSRAGRAWAATFTWERAAEALEPHLEAARRSAESSSV